MIRLRGMSRRLAAGAAAVSLGCGLAVAGAWTAQAAVPNAWGFALVTSPSGPVSSGHWGESVPSPTPVATPGGPGQVHVRFPHIGAFKNGVVQVSAVIDELAWCQAQSWGPLGGAEIVTVRCFRQGGKPTFVPFTVMFSESSGKLPGGLSYAYLHGPGTAAPTSFNSTGHANHVTTLGTGRWLVRLPGPGPATPAGGVQVTAVNTKPRICDIAARSATATAQLIQVRCYNALGSPAKTGWNLTYQRVRAITGNRPKFFAYTAYTKLVCPPVLPPAAVRFNSAGGANTISCSGLGERLVKLTKVGFLNNIVFVTAAAPAARVCNLNTTWGTAVSNVLVRNVVCYKPSGAMTPVSFLLSYTAKP